MVDQTPIASLTETNPDIENITAALDLALEDINEEGWWYNTDYNVEYPTDNDGFITLPSYVRKVAFADGLVQRGTRVYDSINNTFIFTEPKRVVSQVTLLSWDDTHPNATKAAAYKAASDFAESETLSVDRVQSAQRGFARAYIDLKKEHLTSTQANMFDSMAVQRARRGVVSLGRQNRFFGDPDH